MVLSLHSIRFRAIENRDFVVGGSLTKLSRGAHQRFACWGNTETTNLCGNGYILQQQRVIPVCYFAKEASCSMLKEDDDVRICRQGFQRRVVSQELKLWLSVEKQEITIEKVMRNKRKCITTVKGLQLFAEFKVKRERKHRFRSTLEQSAIKFRNCWDFSG
ncbi:uncharacterized protein LOC126629776 isoform X2 [Malus sylvestris]|uniref:uncharacterized protein LOC126629776 isoform X2 n=1 Tax=Malus sylvestris TaxID=3752 RepID=UPI0021AD314B|nr:uncharacterized protein LOC126629776 isoform X2 [Malus sylvestris]